jgi:hypothetical protein
LYYFKDGGTRPIYSIRHTYATELYKKGVTIQDIATSMNTSERMIMSVYLGLSDQTQNSKRAVFTALFLPQTKTSLFILSNVKTFKNLQLLTI